MLKHAKIQNTPQNTQKNTQISISNFLHFLLISGLNIYIRYGIQGIKYMYINFIVNTL